MKNIFITEEQASYIQSRLEAERDKVNTSPTDAQAKAGNYAMGHITIHGLEISIENPKGSYRRGKDKDGKAWETYMNNDYGYFSRTVGKDGDAIDVFIGPNLDSKKVFPIDQYVDGEFDETKVMLGFDSKEEAKAAYLSNYEKDWKGFKYITEVDLEKFKKWLYDGYRQRKPFAKYTRLNESYQPMDSNPLNKTFISFGTNELDKSKFLPISTIMRNNKPEGGIWAAELHDEGGSDWKSFVDCEMPTKHWIESLKKHIVFKLKPSAKIFIIDGRNSLYERGITKSFFGWMLDYEKLQKDGFDGVFLSEKGNLELHNDFTLNFNSWDIASICVFNPDVIEVIPENVLDFDKNMGDNGSPYEEEEWWYGDSEWEPDKRETIKNRQMDRMWRQHGNLNVEPDMSKYFNGKELGIMAQQHGNSKDAKIARNFKGTVKEGKLETKYLNSIINKIYTISNREFGNVVSDTAWEHVREFFARIATIPEIGGMDNIEVYAGVYHKYDDVLPYRTYDFQITTQYGVIDGQLTCHAAGSMDDKFKRYDMSVSAWKHKEEMMEGKSIFITEKQMKFLQEKLQNK